MKTGFAFVFALAFVFAQTQPTPPKPTQIVIGQIALPIPAAGSPALIAAFPDGSVRGINPVSEVPAAGNAGQWTLAHTPVTAPACYRNGLRQMPGTDYTITGTVIASAFWQAGDSLVCDYAW